LLFAGVACREKESDVAPPTPDTTDGKADETSGDEVPANGTPVELIDYPFSGKIAIVTDDMHHHVSTYWAAYYLVQRLGSDKIIHRTWPYDFVQDSEEMIRILLEIAEDPEVKALVINRAVVGTYAAVDALLELRDDIFIVYCNTPEFRTGVESKAHLHIDTNNELRGEAIIATAKAMGAEVFVHCSFPRHLAMTTFAARRNLMMAACEREGILFVDLSVPDPTGPDGLPTTSMYFFDISEDYSKLEAEHGKSIALFATSCVMQAPLQRYIIQVGAIYPEPCCPSPYHAFPVVLEVMDRIFDGSGMGVDADGEPQDKGRLRPVSDVVGDIRESIAARGATGRLATWPVPEEMMYTYAGMVYSTKWINGEVPRERGIIDYAAFKEICETYIYESTGEHLGVELNPLSISGRSYNNFLLVLPDSIVF